MEDQTSTTSLTRRAAEIVWTATGVLVFVLIVAAAYTAVNEVPDEFRDLKSAFRQAAKPRQPQPVKVRPAPSEGREKALAEARESEELLKQRAAVESLRLTLEALSLKKQIATTKAPETAPSDVWDADEQRYLTVAEAETREQRDAAAARERHRTGQELSDFFDPRRGRYLTVAELYTLRRWQNKQLTGHAAAEAWTRDQNYNGRPVGGVDLSGVQPSRGPAGVAVGLAPAPRHAGQKTINQKILERTLHEVERARIRGYK